MPLLTRQLIPFQHNADLPRTLRSSLARVSSAVYSLLDAAAHVISKDHNYAEWALMVTELDDAREHLERLVQEMTSDPDFDETEFRIQLEHVYSHLNRAWNGRNQTGSWTDAQHTAFSSFPSDLQPTQSI